MTVSLFLKNREPAVLDSQVVKMDVESLDQSTPAIVLIDLGLCGGDSWACYHEANNQLVKYQPV